MEEANFKLYTIQFYFYDILKKLKGIGWRAVHWLPGVGEDGEFYYKGLTWGTLRVKELFCIMWREFHEFVCVKNSELYAKNMNIN